MIKFFRQIRLRLLTQASSDAVRQRMIKENPSSAKAPVDKRVSKYMLYAIGEILLVVIGILIALQINNWNETRKVKVIEVALLSEIRSNIEATLLEFQIDTTGNSLSLVHLTRIQDYINKDLPYSSELDIPFGRFTFWSSPYPILTGYKTLQTKGMDLISNDSLRNDIAMLYELEYLMLSKDYDKTEWDLAQSTVHPIYAKHIRKNNQTRDLARPNDFEQLKKNDEFSNVLSLVIRTRQGGLRSYRTTMNKMHQVIQDITMELDSRTEDN